MSILSDVFVPRAEGLDGVAFRDEYMAGEDSANKRDNDGWRVYKVISEAQRESDLTFDFSYDIAERAVGILRDVEEWGDDDAITEAVDAAVPVYTHELMSIYAANSWAVDDAVSEYGHGENADSDAGRAWYMVIERMAQAIKNGLEDLIEDEE